MLFILDKSMVVQDTLSNKGETTHITPFFDDEYTSYLETGAETYKFSTLANTRESQHLVVGNHIAFQYEGKHKLFTITEIEETHDEDFIKTVYCEMTGLRLLNSIIRPMTFNSTNLKKFLEIVLENTDWSIGKIDLSLTNVCDFEITNYTNAYSMLQEYVKNYYNGELEFSVNISGDTATKQVNVYANRGSSDGFRFSYDSNLTSVVRTVDTSNLATALIGVGKNGITFKEVEASDKPLNQDFIADENAYKLWNYNGEHILGYEQFDTESPHELLKLTREKLEERKEPKVKYELKPELLNEVVSIGDTVYVIDNEFNPPIHLSARVSELTISLTNSENNSCVLANFVEVTSNITDEMRKVAQELEGYVDSQFPISGDKIQDDAISGDKIQETYTSQVIADAVYASLVETEELIADKATIGDLTATNAKIENLEAEVAVIDKLVANKAEIEDLTATNAKIENLVAKDAEIENLVANKATIEDLEATNAQIGKLNADKANITDLTATNAKIENLQASKADIGELNAIKADINELEAGKATIGQLEAVQADIEFLNAGYAKIEDLEADKADIKDLNATNATIENLRADVANIDELVAKKANIEDLNATNANIDNLVAKDAEIENLIADKADIRDLNAANANIGTLTANLAQIDSLVAKKADIGELNATNANIKDLQASHANLAVLVSEKASIQDLTATNANISNLTATKADIAQLNAANANIEILQADYAKIDELVAKKANITDLNVTNANVQNLQANKADIIELNATKGEITELKSQVAEIGVLKGDVADIENILAGNITADNIASGTITSDKIQTGTITSGSGIIADGAIGNAQISSLEASKISSGTIDTSKVTVQGTNGNLKIKGNRLQVFTGTGSNQKERVSLGDVNGNGSVYGLRVRGADGTTVLLDENGVTSEGITDGSISNEKISDDANIDGSKLNINSVVSKLNEDGTEVIKGTKIEVNGTSLTTKLSTITTKQTQQGEQITENSASIKANEDAIKLKVDNQTYQTDKTSMVSKLEKNTSDINVMKGEIALKVEQTDIENAKSELEDSIDNKVASAKSEIKVTTDKISQNVTNLTNTVSNKADGSTVTTLSNKVGTLETSVNGISGKVTNLEKTTTTLGTNVSNAQSTADSAVTKANTANSTANSNKTNITNLQGEVSTVKSDIASLEVTTSGISQKVSNVESTTATLTTQVNTANTNATSAINKANTAQSTADSKAKVFTSTPTVPYKVGDLWVQGTSGDVMKCKTARSSGSYTASDWEKASKYTDDTKANSVDSKVGTLQTDYNSTKSKVATIETNLDGITQRVGATETTTTTLQGTLNDVKNTANSNKGNITNLQGEISTVKSDVASLEVTTSGISQKVSNVESTTKTLSTQVSNAQSTADSAVTKANSAQTTANTANTQATTNKNNITSLQGTVNTTNSKVAEITTNLDSITQRVSSTESTTSELTTKVNKAQEDATTANDKINNLNVGTRNLLKDTSSELKSVTFGGWDYYFPNNLTTWVVGEQLTGRIYLKPTNQEASCMLHVRYTDSTYTQTRGNIIKSGEEGYSVVTAKVNPPSGKVVSHIQFSIRHSANNTPSDTVYYKEAKVEKGNKATDWTPAPEDVQSQIDTHTSQISTTNSRVAEITTNLDSITQRVSSTESTTATLTTKVNTAQSTADSAKTTANTANSQATTNKNNISSLTTTVNNTNNKVATIETNLDGITQRVSSTESTVTSHTTQLGTVDSRINTAKNSAISTASSDATTKANNALSNAKTYTNSQITTVNETINNKVAEIKTTTDAISQRVSSTESTLTTTTNKINNLQVGGRNLIKQSVVKGNNVASSSYDKDTATWTLTANSGVGGTWGAGLVISGDSVRIPYGKTYVLSFEIKVPRNCSWNIDVNNYAVSGSSWNSNDNDYGSVRETSSKSLVANQWIKCWSRISNTHSNNTDKVDIYDNSNFGVVMQNETSNMTFQIRNIQGEIGNIPSEYTPAPEDVQSQIDTAQSTADTATTKANNAQATANTANTQATTNKNNISTLTTTVNNTNSKVSSLETNLNSITSRVSATETNLTATTNKIDSLEIGGRNYIKYGKGNEKKGFFTNFSKVENGYGEHTLTSQKTYANINIASGFVLGVRDYEVGKQVTFSYEIMYTNWNFPSGTNRSEFWIGQRYTGGTSTSTDGQWKSVTQHNLPVVGSNGCELNKWFKVEKNLTIPSQAHSSIGSASSIQFYNSNADVSASVTFRIRNVKIEYGNKATDWSPAPEDMETTVSNLTTRVSNAESKLTKDSLTTTIGSHYTTSSDVNGLITSKGYATTSEVKQTTDGLSAKFSSSGGYNLIRNSTGANGTTSGWTHNGSSMGTSLNENISTGSRYFMYLDNGTTTGEKFAYSPRFKLRPNTVYRFTGYFHNYTACTNFDVFVLGSTTLAETDTTTGYDTVTQLISSQNTNSSWKKYTLTFTTPANVKSGYIRIDNNGYNSSGTGNNRIHWHCLTLTAGELEVPWSPHPSEVYDGITTIDKNGIKVSQSNYSGYTQMKADGFYVNNGSENVISVTSSGATFKGKVTIQSGSTVPTSTLSGTISSGQLESTITSDISTAKTNASTALSTANTAKSTADTAKSTADTAKSTAATASTNATNAVNTANTANTTANSAKTTATTANTNATTALNTANSVNTTVNNGKTNWNNAYNRVNDWAYGAVTGSTTIDGGYIQANTIVADKIAVMDFTNYADLNANTLSKWGWTSVADSSATSNPWFQRSSISRDNQISKYYTCNGGESLRVKADIFTSVYGQASNGGTATATARAVGIMIFTINADGSRGYICNGRVTATSTSGNTGTVNNVVTLPTTARQFAVYVQIEGYPTFSGTLRVRNVQVTKMSSGELIVDGSITTSKIASRTIVADDIATGAITANEIKSGTITANQIASNTITATQLATGSVTADEIASGAVTATKIASRTITADRIASGAITANEIAASTITAAKIASGTITATQIAANTITAAKIASGTITATQLAANAITAEKIASDAITGKSISGGTIKGSAITGGTFSSENNIFQVLSDGTVETEDINVSGTVSTEVLTVGKISNSKYPEVLDKAMTVYIKSGATSPDDFYHGAVYGSFKDMLSVAPRNLQGYTLDIVMQSNITENVALNTFVCGQVDLSFQGYTLYGNLLCYGASMVYRLYGGNSDDAKMGLIMPTTGRAMGSYYYCIVFQYCQFAVNNIGCYPDKTNGTNSGGIGCHRGATGNVFSVTAYGDMRYLVRAEYAARVHVRTSSGACNNATFCASAGGIITIDDSQKQAGRSTSGNPYWTGSGGCILNNQVLGMANVTFSNTANAGTNNNTSGTTTQTITETITASLADTYRLNVYTGWKKDGTVRQGDWGYGDCIGLWFFDSKLSAALSKGTTKSVSITITRQSGGNSAAVTHTLKAHNHTTRPSGAPTMGSTITTFSLATGASTTLNLTAAQITTLKTGKGIGLQSTYSSAYYSVCSGTITIKVTYTT